MNSEFPRERRNLIVLSVLLAFPIYATVHQFTQQRRVFRQNAEPFDVHRLSNEVGSFKSYLDLQSVTGFFSELTPDDPWNGVEFIKLQYGAVPNILGRFTRSKYVIAEFRDLAAVPAFLQREHFKVLKSYPDGLCLLESTI